MDRLPQQQHEYQLRNCIVFTRMRIAQTMCAIILCACFVHAVTFLSKSQYKIWHITRCHSCRNCPLLISRSANLNLLYTVGQGNTASFFRPHLSMWDPSSCSWGNYSMFLLVAVGWCYQLFLAEVEVITEVSSGHFLVEKSCRCLRITARVEDSS